MSNPHPTHARRRGRPSKAEQARRGDARPALIEAAHELMLLKNSIDVSVVDIANRLGQSAAVVQYHFDGKDGLLWAVLRRGTNRAVEQLTNLKTEDIPADQKLRYHIRGLLKAYYDAPYVNALMHHLSENSGPGGRDAVMMEFARPLVDFYEAVLAQGVREGIFRPVEPMFVYMMLIGASDYIFSRRSALPALFDVSDLTDAIRRDYTDFLTTSLLKAISV
ncbi:TetR family transcriptional regulator [Tistrella mobilis]|nr:TetR family transcriptional regulator [uncultured Tistrella sp.]